MRGMKVTDYLSKFPKNTINIIGPMRSATTEFVEPNIFVDGGAALRSANSGFSLGDNDSFDGKLDEILPTEKHYSDFAYALSHCQGFKTLNLFGFLGGRKDHEIINLGEVHHFLKQSHSHVNFENQIMAFSHGTWDLNHSGTFSIFCFESTLISIKGNVHYKLEDSRLKPFSSHGLSNIGQGRFSIKSDNPFFIFLEQEMR